MRSLRELRKAAGLTQAQLAFLMDVTPFTIARWEQGESEPTASRIRKLAWALRTDETTILEAICGSRFKQPA